MRRLVTLCVGVLAFAPLALPSSAALPTRAARPPTAAAAPDPGPPPNPAWAEAEAWRRIVVWVDGTEAAKRQEWIAGVEAAQAQQAAAAAAAQRPRSSASSAPAASSSSGGPAPTASGSCAAMAPPGFPAWIIQRESGGDPGAVNASSGALGCAQILPSWFASGHACAGLAYAACWALLWNGGAGAGNWR